MKLKGTHKNILGNRANYVLIEDGQTSIFFSRWSALDIPATLLAGPEATLAYVRQFTLVDDLLHDIWAEGGVLLARRWPGWQINGHVEGLVRHIMLSGRDATKFHVPEQQAIQELIAELSYAPSINPAQIAQMIQQTLPLEDQQEIKFGTGFFNANAPPLDPQERRDMLNQLFSTLTTYPKVTPTRGH